MTGGIAEWMSASSLVVSIAVLVFGLIQYKQTSRKDYVDELSRRLDKCEERCGESEKARLECERERERLTRLTSDLMVEARTLAMAVVRKTKEAT